MSLSAGTRLGPYELVALVGSGGMGEVYRARDTRLDRTVAIKVLPPHLAADPEFRDRFEREARAIAALNHPHICAIYDVGHEPLRRPVLDTREDGARSPSEREGASDQCLDFLVLEYLEGETLAARLTRGAVPLAEALTMARQMAGALDTAHRQGITHRDLKPANVMLTKAGTKLLDFGLAKARGPTVAGATLSMLPTMSANLTAAGTILGTVPVYCVIDARV